MWKFISQQNIYRRSYKTASRPPGIAGIVARLDGYDASDLLGFCKTVKLIWSGKINQMLARLIWKYVEIYMSTEHIETYK